MSYLVVIPISISALPVAAVVDRLYRTAIRGYNFKVAGIEPHLLRTKLVNKVIVTERIAVDVGIAKFEFSAKMASGEILSESLGINV